MLIILIVIATDRISGPARQVVQLAERLDKNEFIPIFAGTLIGPKLPEFFLELHRRKLPFIVLSQKTCFDPTPLWVMHRSIRREKIDILQTHGYKACAIGFALRLLTGKRWIHFMHGHTSENRKMSLYFWLEFRLARFADQIVTVSDEMRCRLVARGLPEHKSITIHNAIDPEQFHGGAEAVTREQFSVTENEQLIGVVGRLSPEKGVDIFIEAFHLLAQEYKDLRAILIGEGPQEEKLRIKVSEYGLKKKIIFAGYQPHIISFYPLIDLLVLPSRSEGLPNVAMEALYFGVPIVATSVGGTPEVVIDGETGLLVPTEDPVAMKIAMKTILLDRILRKNLVDQGKKFVDKQFTPIARIEKIEGLYRSLNHDLNR